MNRWLERLRRRVQPVADQARGRWQALARRERRQLVLMAAVVVVAAVWLFGVRPALETLGHWKGELPRLRSQAKTLQGVLADAAGPAAGVAPGLPATPAGQRVRASLDAAGLAGQYELHDPLHDPLRQPSPGPEGAPARLQLIFEPAADPALAMAWLLNAPAALGLAVQEARMARVERGAAEASAQDEQSAPGQGTRIRAAMVVQQQSGEGR